MKKYFILLILFVFISISTSASHQVAAEIYYDYIAPLRYKIHLKIYRDCIGVNQGGTEQITVYSKSLGLSSVAGCNITLDTLGSEPNGTGKEVGDVCPNIGTNCTTPTSFFNGFQEWHYSGIVDLPAVAKDWKFEWTSCCRNPSIINIPSNAITVYALLNNIDRSVNNSIRFSQKPIFYTCIYYYQQMVIGPYDPDGDKIYAIASTPLENGVGCTSFPQDYYTYNPPFTTNSPLPNYINNYNVNALTGTALYIPTSLGNYVLSYRFYDIHNGDTLGMVMRDAAISVGSCGSPSPNSFFYPLLPTITNLVGGILDTINGEIRITLCQGSHLSFDISDVALTIGNTLSSSSNHALSAPGSTVISTPPASLVTSSFSWTPQNPNQNTLVFTFADSICNIGNPIVYKTHYAIKLNVLPAVNGGGPYAYCAGDDTLMLIANGDSITNNWTWSVLPGSTANPNFLTSLVDTTQGADTTFLSPIGTPPAVIYLSVTGLPALTSGCPNIDTVEVKLYDSLIVSAGPDILNICPNDTITISGIANNYNGTAAWWPNLYMTNNSNTSLTPTCVPLAPIGYKLIYTDSVGCKASDSIYINTNGPNINALIIPNDTICLGQTATIIGMGGTSYNISGGVSQGVPFTPTVTTTYTISGTNTNNCTNTFVKTIEVVPIDTPIFSIVSVPSIVTIGNPTIYIATIFSAINNYTIDWYKNNVLMATSFSPNITYSTTNSSISDSVYAWLIPSGFCSNPDSAKSNTILVNLSESIDNINMPQGFASYPNPTNSIVSFDGLLANDIIIITDVVGKVIMDYTCQSSTNNSLDLQPISNGIYNAKFIRDKKQWSIKIVKE